MFVFWPDAVRNDKLFDVNIHETSVLKPPLQFGSGTGLVAGLLKRAQDFVVIALETGAIQAAVLRGGVAVIVLEFNPTSGLD